MILARHDISKPHSQHNSYWIERNVQDNIDHVESTSSTLEIDVDLYEAEQPSELYQAQVALKRRCELSQSPSSRSQRSLEEFFCGSDAKVFSKIRKKEAKKIVIDMKNNHRLLRDSVEDSTVNGTSPKLLDVIIRMVNCIGYEPWQSLPSTKSSTHCLSASPRVHPSRTR